MSPEQLMGGVMAKNDGGQVGLLYPSAITLAIELCGNIDLAIELLSGNTKAEYWQGIKDAIKAQNRIAERNHEDMVKGEV